MKPVTCLLLCVALVGALPALLPGDPGYQDQRDSHIDQQQEQHQRDQQTLLKDQERLLHDQKQHLRDQERQQQDQPYEQQRKDQEQLLNDSEQQLQDQGRQLQDQQQQLSQHQQQHEQQQTDQEQFLKDQEQLQRDQQRNQNDQLQQLHQREQTFQLDQQHELLPRNQQHQNQQQRLKNQKQQFHQQDKLQDQNQQDQQQYQQDQAQFKVNQQLEQPVIDQQQPQPDQQDIPQKQHEPQHDQQHDGMGQKSVEGDGRINSEGYDAANAGSDDISNVRPQFESSETESSVPASSAIAVGSGGPVRYVVSVNQNVPSNSDPSLHTSDPVLVYEAGVEEDADVVHDTTVVSTGSASITEVAVANLVGKMVEGDEHKSVGSDITQAGAAGTAVVDNASLSSQRDQATDTESIVTNGEPLRSPESLSAGSDGGSFMGTTLSDSSMEQNQAKSSDESPALDNAHVSEAELAQVSGIKSTKIQELSRGEVPTSKVASIEEAEQQRADIIGVQGTPGVVGQTLRIIQCDSYSSCLEAEACDDVTSSSEQFCVTAVDTRGVCCSSGDESSTLDSPRTELAAANPKLAPATPELTSSGPELAPTSREMASISPELAPTSTELAFTSQKLTPTGPKLTPNSPELAPASPELAPTRPELTPISPKLATTTPELVLTSPTELTLTSPELAPTSPKVALTSLEQPLARPELAPTSPKLAPTSPELVPTSPELAPTSSELAPASLKLAPTSPELVPTSPDLISTSPELASTSPKLAHTSPELVPSSPKMVPTSPRRPTQVSECSEQYDCVQRQFCGADDFVERSQSPTATETSGRAQSCRMQSGEAGVCCRIPPAVATEIICNFNEDCVEPQLCGAKGFILNGTEEAETRSQTEEKQLGPYGTFCRLPLGGRGRCCRLPDSEWPSDIPVPSCGHSYHIPLPGDGDRHSREALFGEIPWQANIFEKGTNQFVCGGTIVSARHILTSDHCVQKYHNSDVFVRVGDYIIHQESEPLPYQDLEVYSIRTHPLTGALFNDIVVMELTSEMQFDAHIQPICMPEADQNFDGARCVISGWGKPAFIGAYSERMERIELPVVEQSECNHNLRDTHLGHFFTLDSNMMCAGGEQNADACRGDAGGPLACRSADGAYVLAGVAAWSVGCGLQGVPSVYTSVSRTLSFTGYFITGEQYHPLFQSSAGRTGLASGY